MLPYTTQRIVVFNAEDRNTVSHSSAGSFVRLCSNKINLNFDINLISMPPLCQKVFNFNCIVSGVFEIFNTNRTIVRTCPMEPQIIVPV